MIKKIGIVTLQGNFNYGNRLQLYATSLIYSKIGCRPVNLVLKRAEPRTLADFIATFLMRVKRDDPLQLISDARLQAFREFSETIPTETYAEVSNVPYDDFTFFSTGSDQVWNPGMIRDRSAGNPVVSFLYKSHDKKWRKFILDWYFLGFCNRKQRIALSPSIGLDSLDDIQSQLLFEGIENFDRISIREKRGAEIIEQLTGKKAAVICDPTLVLSDADWRAVAGSKLTPVGGYIFTYLLGGMGTEARSAMELVLQKYKGCKIVSLSDRQKPDELDAGPAEFISLIDNARHVITDSFHAAVFASILQTPLTIVHREGGLGMFSRLESLTSSLGTKYMVYGSPEFDFIRASDYGEVPSVLENERRVFLSYLNSCINE